jgi:hypothetical protein
MRVYVRAGVAAVALLSAACTDTVREQPTAPDSPPSMAVNSGPCSSTLRQRASDDIDALFVGTYSSSRTAARQRLTDVARACSTTDPSAARPAMFTLIELTISTFQPGTDATKTATDPQLVRLARLWNTLVEYIGYTPTGISSAALTSKGAARIVSDASFVGSATQVDIVTGDGQALLRVPKAAAAGQQILYTIAPISCGGLSSTLPVSSGKCYDITDTPDYGSSFTVPLTVAICQTQLKDSPAPITANGISHLNKGAKVPGVLPLKYVEAAGFCVHPSGPYDPTSNVFAQAWNTVTRLASSLFAAKPLFALHGNLGGSTTALSPFGPVDRDIFRATFTANPLRALTSPTDIMYGDDVGRWSAVSFKDPGSIAVVGALAEATNTPVALNQGGGNCADSCGGLVLEGEAITTYDGKTIAEDVGKYVVTWDLVQTKPSVKEAPFILLTDARLRLPTDAPNAELRDTVVKIAYVTRPDGRFIRVNGADFKQGTTVLSWEPGRTQSFRFEIDLTTSPATCTLRVKTTNAESPATVIGSCSRGNDLTGKRLRFIRADFTGIDAGIFAWDNIRSSLFSTSPLATQ